MYNILSQNMKNIRIKIQNLFYLVVYYWFAGIIRINKFRKSDSFKNRQSCCKGDFGFAVLFIALLILVLLSGCESTNNPYNKSSKTSKNTQPMTNAQLEQLLAEKGFNPLGRIRSIAVAPCYNLTESTHLDCMQFSEAIASNLSYLERFEITYPREVINKGMALPIPEELPNNKKGGKEPVAVDLPVTTKAANNNKLDDKRPRIISNPKAPIKLDMLTAIAQALDVDALLVVYVKEYDPYNPPKITIATKLILINTNLFTVAEHQQLRFEDMSEYGLDPSIIGNREKVEKEMLWKKTLIYDAGFVKTKREIKSYAKKHSSKDQPMGEEFCTRIMANYYGFIGFELTRTVAMATDPKIFEKQYKEYEKELKRNIAEDEREQRKEERAMRSGKD